MHSERMRTDAISESMIYTNPIIIIIVVQCDSGAAIPFIGVIQDRICVY